jgi:RNA polymerase sigma factor (sigma-70 family)
VTDDEAAEQAYRDHYWAVVRYAARRLPDRQLDPHDVAAAVFVTAWRRRSSLPQPSLPWLYGVARNELLNATRGSRRRGRLSAALRSEPAATAPVEGGASGTASASEAPGPSWVLTALGRLSPADREVLRLTAWEGLDTDQLATALGCSRSAAAMRLSRARTRLQAVVHADPALADILRRSR